MSLSTTLLLIRATRQSFSFLKNNIISKEEIRGNLKPGATSMTDQAGISTANIATKAHRDLNGLITLWLLGI